MSLNWDISKIENWEELRQEVTEFGEKGWKLDGLTEAFVWQSMVTGLGKGWSLDAEFAPEFYARIKLLESLSGPLVLGGKYGDNYKVTPEDVQRHIGLHTNVSPVSRAAFIKNVVTRDLDRRKSVYERKVKEAEAKQATA